MDKKSKETEFFVKELSKYKKLIDKDIKEYSTKIKKSTKQYYGANSKVATDAFLDILARGGKRIRGALAIVGYEMMGGKNKAMILESARALEMIHAYLLIMDDIQDRSLMRRGGSSAYIALAEYHKKHNLSGDSNHFGISIALNAMGIGNHASQVIIANLDVEDDLKIKALSILNQTVVITAHGQTNDIMNEVNGKVEIKDVCNVMEWKTAYYTFLNPITFGMVLAGADCSSTDAVREYALNAGRAFQITDDILGVFGNKFESGKSPMDDIKEGKKTLLTVYALNNAEKADKNFLIQMLGNQKISKTQFERCKDIIVESGALKYAQDMAKKYSKLAILAIELEQKRWPKESTMFFKGLAEYLLSRTK